MATNKPFSNATNLCEAVKAGADPLNAMSTHLSHEQIALWGQLRSDETDRMLWEETRAGMTKENPVFDGDGDDQENVHEDPAREEEKDADSAKKGVSVQFGLESASGVVDGSPAKAKPPSLGIHGAIEHKEEEREDASADIAAALRHCNKGRTFVLNERKSAECIWTVERVMTPVSNDGSRREGGSPNSFILKWRSSGGAASGIVEGGSVFLEDLKSVVYESSMTRGKMGRGEGAITLSLKSSLRALKTCGGRTRLVLKCIKPAEDEKWFMCLKCLFEAKT